LDTKDGRRGQDGADTHFLETGGRIYGFCNAFCRDKTVADLEAWPKFMAIHQS
jgi:glutathione S-transferase